MLKSVTGSDDAHNWAALLYIAIAHANGGNDVLREVEERRLQEAARQPKKASPKRSVVPAAADFQSPKPKPPPPKEPKKPALVSEAAAEPLEADKGDEDQLALLMQEASLGQHEVRDTDIVL